MCRRGLGAGAQLVRWVVLARRTRVGGSDGQLRGARGDPQDQAHRRDHAGEPFVRHLFRHLPGGGRHPDAERHADSVRSRPCHRGVRGPLSRPRRCQRGRTAQLHERDQRHQRRHDERFHRPGRGRQAGMHGSQRPCLHQLGYIGRDGVPHAERHPQLLDLRQGLRPPRPHVRTQRVVEPARPLVLGIGVGGLLHAGGQSLQLRQRDQGQSSGKAPGVPRRLRRRVRPKEEQAGQHHPEPPAHLCLDRPDLPAAQGPRQLGLLRRQRHGAGLREPCRRDVWPGQPERQHPRDLEPAALVRHRARRTTSSATSRT